jgi:hypothetical protein
MQSAIYVCLSVYLHACTLKQHCDLLQETSGFHGFLRIHSLKIKFFIRTEVNTVTVPLQAWSGPEGSRKLRFPDFMTTAQDGGKVVSLTHRPPVPPGNTPGTHFC